MLKKIVLGLCVTTLLSLPAMAADKVQQDMAAVTVAQQSAVAAAPAEKASVTRVKEEIKAKDNAADKAVQAADTTAAAKVDTNKVPSTTPTVATPKTPSQAAPVQKVSNEKTIRINLASRILTLYQGNTKIRMYPVGVGKTTTPTPIGYYKVIEKDVNPVWTDPENLTNRIESGDDNPLGYRWLGFYSTYGIHGTNRPYSIGGYVSNGCVRMHEEDVEDLYTHVSVGTAVEIYYDRIVIDKDADHTISYYIYPDGYDRQSLDIASVRNALAGYGVDNFETDESISEKINASDGEPTYIAKAYALRVNGKTLPVKALAKSGVTYIPAVAVAQAVNVPLSWDSNTAMLTSPYGQAPGIVKRDTIYIGSADASRLYHLAGRLTGQYIYELNNQ